MRGRRRPPPGAALAHRPRSGPWAASGPRRQAWDQLRRGGTRGHRDTCFDRGANARRRVDGHGAAQPPGPRAHPGKAQLSLVDAAVIEALAIVLDRETCLIAVQLETDPSLVGP